MSTKIAIATCAAFPNLAEDEPHILRVLAMRPQIFGQDHMASSLGDGIVSRFGREREGGKPLAYFLIGTPGVGKSATGEAVALPGV